MVDKKENIILKQKIEDFENCMKSIKDVDGLIDKEFRDITYKINKIRRKKI